MSAKLIKLIFLTALLSTNIAYSQEPGKQSNKEENFSSHKSEMIKDLNEEKSSMDQVVACVNSAQKREDMKKCYDLKKANMEKIHERKRAKRKEHLQNELKKLDEEGKNPKK